MNFMKNYILNLLQSTNKNMAFLSFDDIKITGLSQDLSSSDSRRKKRNTGFVAVEFELSFTVDSGISMSDYATIMAQLQEILAEAATQSDVLNSVVAVEEVEEATTPEIEITTTTTSTTTTTLQGFFYLTIFLDFS
mgnify:CR=1 FL=1